MSIEVDDNLVQTACELTGIKSKRLIVQRVLELLVRYENRKGILRYYGTGVWKGNVKASRQKRAQSHKRVPRPSSTDN